MNAPALSVAGFEARYGYRAKPAQIRFRLPDQKLCLNGFAFPDVPQALVIFGLGYGLRSLKNAGRLAGTPIHYWGDIDSHGFAMLDQLRSYLPHTRSLLIDGATLLDHEALWGCEAKPTPESLPRSHADERALFDDLCLDRIAPALRLEQERIGFDRPSN